MQCGIHRTALANRERHARVARKAQTELTGILERVRSSLVVHADETGWREDGHNGYVWTFSTPTLRYFLRRGRGKAVVDEVLGDQFAGVLVSDFCAAYHYYDGPKQRRWARPCSSQGQALCGTSTTCGSSTPRMVPWPRRADAVHQLYRQATAFTHPSDQQRRAAQPALPG